MLGFSPARATTLLATATMMALGAVVATPAQAAPAEREPLFASYVALGDSYAAGPLIPLQTGVPLGCLRSNRNYPSLVAETGGVTDFRDVSCSGATTEELFAPQQTQLGVNPPQLDALSPDTTGVTLSIGGNDIGFGEIVQECATRSPLQPTGAACRDFYERGGEDELDSRIDEAAPKVAAALAAIADRAPDAEVLLVGYPAILPDQGPGCFPLIPFSPGDVEYLRDLARSLNTMLDEQAAAAGVAYIDTYTSFIGHDICTPPGTKWIEGLVPTAPAAPVHPNALGMLAMAQAVLDQASR